MTLNASITLPDADADDLTVAAYDFDDGLNALFDLRVDVLTTDAELDLSKIIGHPIRVDLKDEPYLPRIHGIVRGVRQVSAEPSGDSRYELSIVPPLWLATRSADHRIFQDTTADEACGQVIDLYQGGIPKPRVQASAGRPKREYRVQYGESDLEFMLRALAEEGLVAHHVHGQDSADWTIVETTAYVDGGAPRVRFVPPTGTGGQVTGPHVSAIALTAGMEAKAVVVRDYDFKKPEYVLEKRADTSQPLFSGERRLGHYEYLSGQFSAATEKRGQALAQQFLEEARSDRRVLDCRASFALAAGMRFTLEHHPRGDINGQLLVVRARCSVTEDGSGGLVKRNELVCVPAGDPWRPARLPKPRIHGTHLAFVVGQKAGADEIDVDEHGRVKIEFRWDRRDLHEGKPTRYVRASQGWAGADYGLVCLPRVNEEVIVAYLDGDPDEPVIVGRLHNAWSPSPLKLPDQKTQSIWKSKTSPGGGGYNEIMMEDKKGQELLRVHAHRDNLVTVGANQTIDVGGQQRIHVKNLRDDHVEGAVTEELDTSLTTTIGGPQSTTAKDVTEKYDSQSTTIAGKKHTKAGPVDESFASLDTTVAGLHHEKFGTMSLEGGDVTIKAGDQQWTTGPLTWALSGPGYIGAPDFVIETPGSHKETKGNWVTTFGKKGEAGVFKLAYVAADIKFVGEELKVFDHSVTIGGGKIDICATKVDICGVKGGGETLKFGNVATELKNKGLWVTMCGICSIA